MSLAERWPQFSAREVVTRGQARVFAALFVALGAALVGFPREVVDFLVVIMSAGFLCSLTMRGVFAWYGRQEPIGLLDQGDLPVYSVLVPVYREAGMVPQIARALANIDYPAEKLDAILVVEEDDRETRDAVAAASLHAVIVPVSQPRTKPKACNYALQMARGEFVVVYDAEDRPEADQLRKAVAAFRANPNITCFQARLTVDRARRWIAKMFAIDYDLWFRLLLPGISRLGGPLPLGGTSNHFRTKTLVDAGAWDPFNVTEDADLGVRLARLGQRVEILDSTTYEEAPDSFPIWLRQRTRWMKGYMQTLLVHGRDPSMLTGDLGIGGVLLIYSFLGGAVWSSLVNPLMWLVCFLGLFAAGGDGGIWPVIAEISGAALLAVNVGLTALAMLNGGRRLFDLTLAVTYPLYWILISAAVYRAVWQLMRDPFRWEKTPHGAAG
jgi:cellulose synthase/poly-beta-1,6-N-acetylglucosamine synthase-like glycosyltransferase